jgi:hypothetical protein
LTLIDFASQLSGMNNVGRALIDIIDFLQSVFQTMIPLFNVTDVRILPGYQLMVRFKDGLEGRVDLSLRLHGPVFGPLQDEVLFAKAYLELGTWSGRTAQIWRPTPCTMKSSGSVVGNHSQENQHSHNHS